LVIGEGLDKMALKTFLRSPGQKPTQKV